MKLEIACKYFYKKSKQKHVMLTDGIFLLFHLINLSFKIFCYSNVENSESNNPETTNTQ